MQINQRNCIRLTEVSELFQIDFEVCRQFADFGLIRIVREENTSYIEPEEVAKLRHIISLYRDLGVNKEGIEVILSMRDRIISLQRELAQLNRAIDRVKQEYVQKNIELPRKRGMFFEL